MLDGEQNLRQTYFPVTPLSHASTIHSPDRYNGRNVQFEAVDLCNEDGRHCLIQSRPVHVDRSADGQHETGHSLVDPIIVLKATHCQW